MSPSELPAEVREDPKRKAECYIYDRLSETLSDSKFCVFYSKEWLNRNNEKAYQEDGECDFIIAHPELGILFIEVKGGRIITRDGDTGEWYSGWPENIRAYKIKNPIWQARNSKHFFRTALEQRWGNDMPFLKTVHCVLFPDASRGKSGYLGEDMPREIFGFIEDMPTLNKKIYDFYDFDAYNSKRVDGKLGNYGIDILKDMFAKNLEFSLKLGGKIKEDNYLIDKLTDEQSTILNSTAGMNKVLIEGPAGSGKTVLAIKKAVSDAEDDVHKNVLLVCFNTPLVDFIMKQISDQPENLLVTNFHKLCMKLITDNGVTPNPEISSSAFSDDIVTAAIEAIENSKERYQSIIVDEGQDFKEDWWTILQLLLDDNNETKLTVFRDNNQKIMYGDTADYSKLQGPLTLSKIIRNTKEIAENTLFFYKGTESDTVGPIGDPIHWHITNDEQKDLEKLIHRYISYENVNPSSIAVLTVSSLKKSIYSEIKELCGHPVVRSEELGKSIVLDSIYRFKGLEADVVFLCGFDNINMKDEQLYTGISRAKSHLIFIANNDVINRIKELT